VDSLRHEVVVWVPSASKTQPMTVADGEFWQEGFPWYPHGVNYMPSSGMALEDGDAFEYWMDPRAYDPDVIERDLARIQKLKMNMVSVFIYHRSLKSMNLLDLLVRCQRHGLKVNLSLRPGTPMDFRWEEMKEIIETYRLKMQESLFAYDLAWEPVHGTHEVRKRWDPEWVAWLKARYGSVEDAQEKWGVEMPKENDQWTNPSDVQVSTEGAWRPMVASYRQFLNELLLEKYGQARSLVQSVDPQHLVSFRMNVAGDPTVNPVHGMAYEFEGLAGAVDFLAPEGYGRIGEWDRVKDGCFTVALARLANPDLPVLWAEFGMSTWDDARHEASPKRLEEGGRFYRDFYEMILLSGANGSVCWFYPGGYRVGENSDFGILNPDGTLRPVSQAILSYASRIQGRRQLPKSADVVEVTPEDHASGIYGMYEAVKPIFWSKTGRTIPRLVKTVRPLSP
jgi:hypothetical protein